MLKEFTDLADLPGLKDHRHSQGCHLLYQQAVGHRHRPDLWN